MRFKHWLSTFFGSALVAASTITAQAQPPSGYSPEPGFAPVGMSLSGYGPPSMYSPWPEMSPYQDAFSQHQFDGGVWSQIERQSQRRYQLSIDYLTGQTRTSNSLIGNPHAQSYVDLLQFQLGGQQQGGGGGQQQQSPLQPFVDDPSQNRRGYELFGAFDFRKNKEKMNNDGVSILWGYDRPDESGFRLGFLTNQGSFNYNARNGLPSGRDNQREYAEFIIEKLHIINELNAIGNTAAAAQIQSELAQLAAIPSTQIGVFNDPNLVLQNNLDNLNGLPLDDGTLVRFADGTTIGGVTVPYDLEFKVDLRSELYGGNAELVMSPVLNWGSFRLRPTVGVRYFYLAESFRFFGRDSGLAYNGSQQGGGGQQTLSPDVKIHSPPDRIDNNGDGIVDNAGVPESGQQGGGGGGGQQQQQLAFFSFHDHFRYPIESYLNNDSDQHLGGGEIGLNYEFGNRSFLLSGATKFGLLANYGRIRMSGDNIAMHTRDADLLLPSEDDATPNSFTDSKNRSHVSPMFIQSITAEAPLFRYVPILRRSSILEKARFRFGYSFLLIGQVTDTAGSVLWQGNPAADLFPKIKEKRNTYSTQNYNIGVSWEF